MSTQSLDNFVKNLNKYSSQYNSVSEICRQTGINRQQYARYLTGDNLPSGLNLLKLTDFFGINLDELFSDSEPSSKPLKGLDEISPLIDYFGRERCEDFVDGLYRLYFTSLDQEDHILVCECELRSEGSFRKFSLQHKMDPGSLYDMGTDNVFSHTGWLAGNAEMYHAMIHSNFSRPTLSHLALRRSAIHRHNYFGPHTVNSMLDTKIKVVPSYLEWFAELDSGKQNIERTGSFHKDTLQLSPWLKEYLFSFNITNDYMQVSQKPNLQKLYG